MKILMGKEGEEHKKYLLELVRLLGTCAEVTWKLQYF